MSSWEGFWARLWCPATGLPQTKQYRWSLLLVALCPTPWTPENCPQRLPHALAANSRGTRGILISGPKLGGVLTSATENLLYRLEQYGRDYLISFTPRETLSKMSSKVHSALGLFWYRQGDYHSALVFVRVVAHWKQDKTSVPQLTPKPATHSDGVHKNSWAYLGTRCPYFLWRQSRDVDPHQSC